MRSFFRPDGGNFGCGLYTLYTELLGTNDHSGATGRNSGFCNVYVDKDRGMLTSKPQIKPKSDGRGYICVCIYEKELQQITTKVCGRKQA